MHRLPWRSIDDLPAEPQGVILVKRPSQLHPGTDHIWQVDDDGRCERTTLRIAKATHWCKVEVRTAAPPAQRQSMQSFADFLRDRG